MFYHKYIILQNALISQERILVITHKSVLTRFLPIKRGMAPSYPVFIDLYRPLNLGPNEMWVITKELICCVAE